MRRHVSGAERAGQNETEDDDGVTRDHAMAEVVPPHDGATGGPLSDAGRREVSWILRWALADLELALKKVERLVALGSADTETSDGSTSRSASN
jgi:hypothetical protein